MVGYSGPIPPYFLFFLLLKWKFLVQIRGHIKIFPLKCLKAIAYFSFRTVFGIRRTGLFQKKMHMPEYAIFSKTNPHLAFKIAKDRLYFCLVLILGQMKLKSSTFESYIKRQTSRGQKPNSQAWKARVLSEGHFVFMTIWLRINENYFAWTSFYIPNSTFWGFSPLPCRCRLSKLISFVPNPLPFQSMNLRDNYLLRPTFQNTDQVIKTTN